MQRTLSKAVRLLAVLILAVTPRCAVRGGDP